MEPFRTRSLRRTRVWAPAAVLLCALGLAARDSAHASSSRSTATNGLILFQAHVGSYNQLFTIKPDGSGLTQVTKIPFTGDTDGAEQAAWSPDGKTIAFDAPSLSRAAASSSTSSPSRRTAAGWPSRRSP